MQYSYHTRSLSLNISLSLFSLSLISPLLCLILRIFRHAEALHNEAFKVRGRVAYTDPQFLDPELTELGKQQCLELKPQVMERLHSMELVVVSPLRRTLQTALLAFKKVI